MKTKLLITIYLLLTFTVNLYAQKSVVDDSTNTQIKTELNKLND